VARSNALAWRMRSHSQQVRTMDPRMTPLENRQSGLFFRCFYRGSFLLMDTRSEPSPLPLVTAATSGPGNLFDGTHCFFMITERTLTPSASSMGIHLFFHVGLPHRTSRGRGLRPSLDPVGGSGTYAAEIQICPTAVKAAPLRQGVAFVSCILDGMLSLAVLFAARPTVSGCAAALPLGSVLADRQSGLFRCPALCYSRLVVVWPCVGAGHGICVFQVDLDRALGYVGVWFFRVGTFSDGLAPLTEEVGISRVPHIRKSEMSFFCDDDESSCCGLGRPCSRHRKFALHKGGMIGVICRFLAVGVGGGRAALSFSSFGAGELVQAPFSGAVRPAFSILSPPYFHILRARA